MHKASDAFQEGLRRLLAEGGFTWVERPGPPPPGVKILKNAHPPRVAERLCEEGFPLVYIVAVKRRDSSTPLEESCRRGEAVCYVYGDVEWAPELEGKCTPVTFYVDLKEERRALEALLLYIARTRNLPWVSFNREILSIIGLCDAAPNICLTEEAVIKKVEAMRKQLTPQRLEPPKSPTAETSPDDTADATAEPDDTAETTAKSKGAAAGVDKPHAPAPRLDPPVLELVRRCCGEECVARLLRCHD